MLYNDNSTSPYKPLYFRILEASKAAQECDDPEERRRILVTALEEVKAKETEIIKNENN